VLRLLYGLGIRLGLVLGFRDRVTVKVRVSFRLSTFIQSVWLLVSVRVRVRVKVRASFRIVTFVYSAWGNVTK